jgi:DNA (cytosine-5)-methyltransferase 1
MKYFDMFSGIGGFRSALSQLDGFECVGFCEIDKYAQRAYRALYNTEKEYFCDDARKIEPKAMPGFDMLCAGFPCQPFSVAGKRLGFEDTRGTLFHEIARLLSEKWPSFFLLENVPGLLSHDNGRTFKAILSVLVDLGYSLEWSVLNSKNFGLPQQRKRLYIVGYLNDQCAGKIFPIQSGNRETLKQIIGGSQGQRVYKTDGVACTQTAGTGGQGGRGGLYFIDMNAEAKITDVARTITARHDSGISKRKGEHSGVLIEERQHFIDLNANPKITNEARCLHTRMDLEVVGTHKGERSGVLVEEAPRAVLSPEKETVRQNGRRFKEPNEAMFTITAMDRHGIYHKGRVRRLMPIECWRLQGYTDEQFNMVQSIGIPDGQLYKMSGNSVSVPVIFAIGQKIKAVADELGILKM